MEQLTIYYDPIQKNWNERIRAELSRRRLKRGQVSMICLPEESEHENENILNRIQNGAQTTTDEN
jgi:hypothetical protein